MAIILLSRTSIPWYNIIILHVYIIGTCLCVVRMFVRLSAVGERYETNNVRFNNYCTSCIQGDTYFMHIVSKTFLSIICRCHRKTILFLKKIPFYIDTFIHF